MAIQIKTFKKERGVRKQEWPNHKPGPPEKYPFSKLKPGQAFVVPVDEVTSTLKAMRVRASVRGKYLNAKFHVRQTADGGFEVYRSA